MELIRSNESVLAEMRRFSPSLRPIGVPLVVPYGCEMMTDQLWFDEQTQQVGQQGTIYIDDLYLPGSREGRCVRHPSLYFARKVPFRETYPLYVQKYNGAEYFGMIDHFARQAIGKLSHEPDIFVMIPSRKETQTSRSVEVALTNALQSGADPLVLVYHNDFHEPLQETLADLSLLRGMERVLVMDRLVSEDMTMGETRRFLADVAMQVASRLGMKDPIGMALDADTSFMTEGAIKRVLQEFRAHPRMDMCSMLPLEDPASVAADATESIAIQLDNVRNRLFHAATIAQGGKDLPVLGGTMRFGAHCLVGGYLPISVAEDRSLGMQIGRYRGERAIGTLPGRFYCMHDASRFVAAKRRKGQMSRYDTWVRDANEPRPKIESPFACDPTRLTHLLDVSRYFSPQERVMHRALIEKARSEMRDILERNGLRNISDRFDL